MWILSMMFVKLLYLWQRNRKFLALKLLSPHLFSFLHLQIVFGCDRCGMFHHPKWHVHQKVGGLKRATTKIQACLQRILAEECSTYLVSCIWLTFWLDARPAWWSHRVVPCEFEGVPELGRSGSTGSSISIICSFSRLATRGCHSRGL